LAERGRLVGRAGELAVLDAELQRAGTGEFRCVLLSGDPGVGKTRLAEEVLVRSAATCTTLVSRARPLGAAASFGLWAEAFEQHLRELPLEEVAELCGGLLDDLASLLRSVAVVRSAIPDREPPRIRLLESLATLLGNLGRRRPVVLHLDDVHQADASSWEMLDYLGQHFLKIPVLVVATARPGELADQPLAIRVLLDLEQRGVMQRIDVQPLDEAAMQELAEDILGPVVGKDVLEWVGEHSRGNPLFASGLLRALRDEGGVPRPGLRSLPEDLCDRVRTRVGLLDDDAQRVLELLTVANGWVELGELIRFSGRDLDDLVPILRRLTQRSRLVTEDQRGNTVTYEVAHPLIAETIYDGLGGAARFSLHRQVGRALLVAGRLGEAALHFARSADRGDNEAIEVLLEALRQAEERGAYREALKILSAMVDIVPSGDARWLAVADALGHAEWVVDHRADSDTRSAVAALREIDALMDDRTEPGQRAVVKSRLTSFLSWGTVELTEAAAAAQTAIDLYAAAGRPDEARLASLELAYARGLAGDVPALEAGARQVFSEAEAARDDRAAVQALGVLGTAAFYQGKFAESEGALRRSIAMAREAGKPYRVVWGLMSLGWCLGFEGRIDEALAAFEQAKSVPGWRDSNVLELESHVRWLAGDFAGSLACAREALALNPGGLSPRRAHGLCVGALASTELDQLSDAHRYLSMAKRVYGDKRWFFASDFSHQAAGILAWREDRLPEALAALRTAADGMLSTNSLAFAAPILVDVAEVAAQAREPEAAALAASQLTGIVETTGRDLHHALAALAEAWAALARRQATEAEEAAREANGLLPGTVCGWFRARALMAQAEALEMSSSPGGMDLLTEAAALFDASGAAWRRERALAALRTQGSAGRRAADAVVGASGLTSREWEVAQLAAERLTAQEIAERLFISRRTVETHLARVYAKLGVASKSELARRLAEVSPTTE
jgi:DNA-binding CsgD family transcriptional regulator/Holliday junction resolvasome RuvABC ATP-dependent DNA helicase subunit